MADLDVAIYRDNTGVDGITTTPSLFNWDTTVREDGNYTLNGARNGITCADAGHYLVTHNTAASAGGRTAWEERIRYNGSANIYGYALGYARGTQTTSAYVNQSHLINLGANAVVSCQYARIDSTGLVTPLRQAAKCGICIVKLPDDMEFCRIRTDSASNTTGTTASTWIDVIFDSEQEVDSPFTHSTSSTPTDLRPIINLTEGERWIWVLYNFYCRNKTGTQRVGPEFRLVMKPNSLGSFAELDYSRTTGYIRNASGCDETSVHLAGLFFVPSDTAELKVQFRDEASPGNGFDLVNGQSGFTAAYLPDTTLKIIAGEQTGGQSGDTDATITLDTTEVEDSAAYTHSESTDTQDVAIEADGDHVFMGQCYVTTRTNTNRLHHELVFRGNDSENQWGHFGQYDRGFESTTSGASGMVVANISSGVDVDLFHDNDSTGTDSSAVLAAANGALFGFQIGTLAPDAETEHISEGVDLDEAIRHFLGVHVSEGVDLDEAIRHFLGVHISEGVDLDEAIRHFLGVTVTESVELSEAIRHWMGASISEGVDISEVIRHFLGVSVDEQVELVESLHGIIGLLKEQDEGLDISEAPEAVLGLVQQLSETLDLEEALEKLLIAITGSPPRSLSALSGFLAAAVGTSGAVEQKAATSGVAASVSATSGPVIAIAAQEP